MRIYSVFNSIDGEVNAFHQGAFTTFIRTAGCNLRCDFCDTDYALDSESGTSWTLEEILYQVNKIGCPKITITGGEPMLQEDIQELLELLVEQGYQVTVETNGTIQLPVLRHITALNVSWVVDYKVEYKNRMYLPNYLKLTNRDFIKCVISNPDEFNVFIDTLTRLRLEGCCAKVALAPSHGILDVNNLIDWCKQLKMFDFVINVQLHKLLNISESA